jgi:predicted aminopeptidase
MIKRFFIFVLVFLLGGCAKLGYLTEQGIGQMRIQWRGKKNEKVLEDPKVSAHIKRKIVLIEEYKKFFYHYLSEKSSKIYSETSFLDNKAVTYLVVASPHSKIEAYEFSFPFMGSFPYIGFFSLDSAKEFADDLRQDENLVTWIRPVYAYSTLGYFEDKILSSFFVYDDVELAELVFHELFHTVFFIKDEVDLNENLANLYGKLMLREYFKDRPELKSYLEREEKKKEVSKRVVELIEILQTEFGKLGGFITDEKADELTDRFVNEIFRPEMKNLCQKLSLEEDDCEIKDNWNQASFAAFMTYEEDQDFLEKLMQEKNLGLKESLAWLRIEYKTFKSQSKIENFTEFLKLKVPNAAAPTY